MVCEKGPRFAGDPSRYGVGQRHAERGLDTNTNIHMGALTITLDEQVPVVGASQGLTVMRKQ
jgi:hypothetical protein